MLIIKGIRGKLHNMYKTVLCSVWYIEGTDRYQFPSPLCQSGSDRESKTIHPQMVLICTEAWEGLRVWKSKLKHSVLVTFAVLRSEGWGEGIMVPESRESHNCRAEACPVGARLGDMKMLRAPDKGRKWEEFLLPPSLPCLQLEPASRAHPGWLNAGQK